ncbi:MAG TPA: SDR family NAD(P)-dependent oxidoreductase [Acidimicrobiales bacterium]|nr:SDR family NAD(P)-dependent oxidoreductase [Acidimicrobiales bacterium]
MEQLRGKVAVITGAASGIGLAVARQAAAEGMAVVLADVEERALAAATDDLAGRIDAGAGAGAEVEGVVTDVSDAASMAALRDRTLERFGAVHLVHLNAGVNAGGPMWEVPEADWRWILGVNLWGVIHGIRTFVPPLIEQGEGHVVLTASLAGLASPPFMGPYNATKHAVVTISETLLKDLAIAGAPVGVSVLCPGFVNTKIAESDRNRPPWAPMQASEARTQMEQLGRQWVATGMDPAEVAAAVFQAVRDGNFYVLTHPEMTTPMVVSRMHDIVQGRTPGFAPLP